MGFVVIWCGKWSRCRVFFWDCSWLIEPWGVQDLIWVLFLDWHYILAKWNNITYASAIPMEREHTVQSGKERTPVSQAFLFRKIFSDFLFFFLPRKGSYDSSYLIRCISVKYRCGLYHPSMMIIQVIWWKYAVLISVYMEHLFWKAIKTVMYKVNFTGERDFSWWWG